MRYCIKDTDNSFETFFDSDTGFYYRSGILDSEGNDTGKDPFSASFPHLIDVGIMGHCVHGKLGLCSKAGIGCYQSGKFVEKPNMSADDFKKIAEQCRGKCFQFALGGRGDPDMHEHFEQILKICRQNRIVPNFTTSGYGMTHKKARLCYDYCGAVAVSWYRSEYTFRAIEMLLEAGVKTNIHFVLGKNSIDEAVQRLKSDDFPKGINAVIFLLHKPAGQGSRDNVLDVAGGSVREFFEQFDRPHVFKLGLDSCSVPGIINYCRKVLPQSVDTCEGARFSAYIDSELKMSPCSFDRKEEYAVSLEKRSIRDVWCSDAFEKFRRRLKSSCPDCPKRELCLGGCPIFPETTLCKNKERKQ